MENLTLNSKLVFCAFVGLSATSVQADELPPICSIIHGDPFEHRFVAEQYGRFQNFVVDRVTFDGEFYIGRRGQDPQIKKPLGDIDWIGKKRGDQKIIVSYICANSAGKCTVTVFVRHECGSDDVVEQIQSLAKLHGHEFPVFDN